MEALRQTIIQVLGAYGFARAGDGQRTRNQRGKAW